MNPSPKAGFDKEELKRVFNFFDKDGDDSIDVSELGLILRNLGYFPTDSELDQMINDVDINRTFIHTHTHTHL
jgi:calcium-binding protein CML